MPPTPLWPTPQYEAAECLYMIIMEAVAEDGDSRSVFRSGDVADTDGDGHRNLSTAGERRSCYCVGRLVLTRSCRSWQAGKYRAGNMMNTTTITPDISAGNPFSTTEGAYIGGAIKFTEGSLTGQYGKITAYTASPPVFTCQTRNTANQAIQWQHTRSGRCVRCDGSRPLQRARRLSSLYKQWKH